MGMNTPFNFQFDGKNAAINGDFMLLGANASSRNLMICPRFSATSNIALPLIGETNATTTATSTTQ
jgi:hypothetical protein